MRSRRILFGAVLAVAGLMGIVGAAGLTLKAQGGGPVYYISCLKNGIGPAVDLTPFTIFDALSGEKAEIPVGTWVVRATDETGALATPDPKGRILIVWQDRVWWIIAPGLKVPDATGATDCDGHITPVPTLTPSGPVVPTPTATPFDRTNTPTFSPGRFAVPGIISVFKTQPPAVMGSFHIYSGATIDLVPNNLEQCVDTFATADLASCDVPGGIPVFAPVAGCAIRLADNASIVVIVVNCEHDIAFPLSQGGTIKGRREVVMSLLDPKSTARIATVGTNVKPGDFIGRLCLDATKKNCGIAADTPVHLSFQLRITNFKEAVSADKEELLGFLATPNCLFDGYLYKPGLPTVNSDPIHGCPAA